MKKIFSILFFLALTNFVNATNWYVDNVATGSNSGTLANPWTSLASINWTSVSAGDTIFISRQIYNEKLVIGKSGSSGSPIIITKYDGADPVMVNPTITGFTSITSWTNVSGNIWESTSAIKASTTMLNIVTINGNFQPIGRYPKSSSLIVTANTWGGGTTFPINGSVTGVLAGSTDYTGGEVVIKKNSWINDRATINSQSYSGGSITLNFTQYAYFYYPVGGTIYPPSNGNSFFVQNVSTACTQQGDWYYNTSTRKLGIYSVGSPSNISAATIDTLIYMSGKSYLSFNNISFEGANMNLIMMMSSSNNISYNNCSFLLAGIQGLKLGTSCTNISISNSDFSHINSAGIYGGSSGDDYFYFGNNIMNNIANVEGMGQSGDGDSRGVSMTGNNILMEGNVISNIGYIGLTFYGKDDTIRKNYIDSFCSYKTDGGAIYTGSSTNTRSVVSNNIVTNGGGMGIYLDDLTDSMEVSENTAANCENGIYIHRSTNIAIHNNVLYNNSNAQCYVLGNSSGPITGLNFTRNTLMAVDTTQPVFEAGFSESKPISAWGILDSNYYCRPINDTITNYDGYDNSKGFITWYDVTISDLRYKSLNVWQAQTSQDAHTKISPKTVNSPDSIILIYNPTNHDSTIYLNANYLGVDSTVYSGSVTLSSYSSKPLIYLSDLPQETQYFKFKKGTLRFGGVNSYSSIDIPISGVNLKPFSSKILIYKSKPDVIVLPVSLINFNASVSGNIVTLNWSTGSESNNDRFDIEISDDGINWNKVKSIKSKAVNGNSNSKLNYSTQIILQ